MVAETFVNRYLYKDGDQQYVDNHGFLCGKPHYRESEFVITMDDYVQFDEIRTYPYAFIIGNGGIGKSTYLSQIEKSFGNENTPYIRINLRDISQEKTLTEKILPFCISKKDSKECFILLDALDEAVDNKICNPNAMIQDAISECLKQNPNIKTILTCRDNRFLTNGLPEFFKKIYKCKYNNIFHLCSLTQDDAKEIAKIIGCTNIEDFINKVLDYNLGPFANSPITLQPLVLLYNNGSMGNNINHFDIYEKLMLNLASETEYRVYKAENGENVRVTSSIILLSIASKIATELKYSKKSYVTTNPNDKDGFYIDNLINVNLYDKDEKINITKELLTETLLTKIFYKADTEYKFAQQTYQDFLVARYLLNLKLKTREILNLLKVNGTFHPYLNEVTAFVSVKNKTIFGMALNEIPDRILFSSVYFNDNKSKEILFDKYIECISKENISFWDYSFNRVFFHKRLYFTGIEKQLSRYLKSNDINICDTTIDFINDNMLQGFEESLKKIFFNKKTSITIKIAILNACENCDYKNLLKNISNHIDNLKDEINNDDNDQLRGAILNALYPDYINISDVFNLLTEPKDKNFFGRYDDFLKRKFVEMVTPNNASLYLDWIKNNKIKGVVIDTHNNHSYTEIVNNIFKRISAFLTFDIINEVISIHTSQEYNYQFFSDNILKAILNNDEFRIYFLKNLILKENYLNHFKIFINYNSRTLYKVEDIPILMNLYQSNEFQQKQEYIRYLLNSYYMHFINDLKTEIDTIYSTIISDSVLKEQFGYYIDSRPISSDTGEPIEEIDIYAKNDYYENIKRALEKQKENDEIKELNDIEFQINKILNSEKDNIRKIIAIFSFLNLEYDSKYPRLDNFNLDINGHQRWRDISSNTQNSIINIVSDYLLNETSDKTTLSDDDIKNNSIYSSWCCFALLKQIKGRNLLPTYTEKCMDLKKEYINDLYIADKEKIINIFDKVVTLSEEQLPMDFLQCFQTIDNYEFYEHIYNSYIVNEQNLSEKIILDLLEFLASKNYTQLIPYLKEHIVKSQKKSDYEKEGFLLNVMLYNYDKQWNYVYKILQQSKNFKSLINIIATRHSYQVSYSRKSLLSILKPEELAAFYNITVVNLEYVNTEHELGVHNADMLKDLIEKIPNYLVEKGYLNAYKKIKRKYLRNRINTKFYKKYYDRGLKTLKYNIAKNLDLNKKQLDKIEVKLTKERNNIVQIGKNNIVGDNANITENNNSEINITKFSIIIICIIALVIIGILSREQVFELMKVIIHTIGN